MPLKRVNGFRFEEIVDEFVLGRREINTREASSIFPELKEPGTWFANPKGDSGSDFVNRNDPGGPFRP